MQAYTFALLVAGVSAGIADDCDSVASAANDFGTGIKSGALQRSGNQDWNSHFQKFSNSLDSFHSSFSSSSSSDFSSDFDSKFSDFEKNFAGAIGHLNTYGNSCGGYNNVWSWAYQLYQKFHDICDAFAKHRKCENIHAIAPRYNDVENGFNSISVSWNFHGKHNKYPNCNPLPTTCSPRGTTTVPTTAHSSTKTSNANPNSTPTSTNPEETDTENNSPNTNPTYSTYAGPSSTYKCKVVAAAGVTGEAAVLA